MEDMRSLNIEERKVNFNNLKVLSKTQYLLKIKFNFKDRLVVIKTNNKGVATSCYWYYEGGFKMPMKYQHKTTEEFIITQFNKYRKTLIS